MNWKSTKTGYGWLPVAMHWLMLLLLIAVYATMELKSIFARGSTGRASMAFWHYSLGLTVFALVWLRLLARFVGDTPSIQPALPAWQTLAAKGAHIALYVLMIGLPVFGWLTLSAKGTAIPFFGAELPALIGTDKELAKWLKEIHETSATVGYYVIGLHALAGLYHHYIRRDNTMRLMWFRS
jgi:cytochrome b561